MTLYNDVEKLLSNIRSIRAFSKSVEFTQLQDMSEKLNSVVEELREEAEKEIKEREEREKRKLELIELISQEGFSVSELAEIKGLPQVRKKRVVQQIPAKYQYEQEGNTKFWTGRGRTPKPIKDALLTGSKIEDFLIKEES